MLNKNRYETMKYRYCGKSGLKLPAMSFGLWHNFGDNKSYESCKSLVLGAFDLGITHFDLANNYGPAPGAAEIKFGEILNRELSSYRDELIISSKAGYDMWEGPYGAGGSKKHLLSSVDQSLKRLNLDYLDIFYHHVPDTFVPLEETVDALELIVRQGKALYIGISNYTPQQTTEIHQLLMKRGIRCLIHQVRYSMLDTTREEIFDVAEENGMGTISFSPLAQGLLTDKYLQGIPNDSRAAGNSRFLSIENITKEKIDTVSKLNLIAKDRNQSLAQMSLAWVLQKSTSVLLGASKVEQLEENVGTISNMVFTKDEIMKINNILNND